MLNFVFSYWLLPSLPPHSFNLINMWSVLGSWTKPSITANSALLRRALLTSGSQIFQHPRMFFFKLPFSGFYFKNLLIATSCVECWWFFFHGEGDNTEFQLLTLTRYIWHNQIIHWLQPKLRKQCFHNLGSFLVGSSMIKCVMWVDFLFMPEIAHGPLS